MVNRMDHLGLHYAILKFGFMKIVLFGLQTFFLLDLDLLVWIVLFGTAQYINAHIAVDTGLSFVACNVNARNLPMSFVPEKTTGF